MDWGLVSEMELGRALASTELVPLAQALASRELVFLAQVLALMEFPVQASASMAFPAHALA